MIIRVKIIITFILVLSFIISCNLKHISLKQDPAKSSYSSTPSKEQNHDLLSFIVLDNNFKSYELRMINDMFSKYDSLQFGSNYEPFRRFFGGDSVEYLTDYLKKRIKYFVRHSEEELQQQYSGDGWKGIGAYYMHDWLQNIFDPYSQIIQTKINGKTVNIDRPRHGVITSGPAFFDTSIDVLERIGILTRQLPIT